MKPTLQKRPGTAHLRRARQAGYSLLEMVIALALSVTILLAVLALFDINNRIARGQVNVADMQQSLRVAQADMIRNVRMAGRGGLPIYRIAAGTDYKGMYLPNGVSIAVDDNVEGTDATIGEAPKVPVVPETDILTVRGVLTTPLFQINPGTDGDISGIGTEGSITIHNLTSVGIPQSLDALKDVIEDGVPEAILLVSTGADEVHAVVEASGGSWSEDKATLRFKISGGQFTADYLKLSPDGAFPSELKNVSAVGILEEYKYYVRDMQPAPRLSRARLYPNTKTAHLESAANLSADIADNILDLQVALGIDRNANQQIDEAGDTADDWLFNAEGDKMTTSNTATWNDPTKPLYYVRITTLARTDRGDPDYVSPPIKAIEDHTYGELEKPKPENVLLRKYRRRLLQTVVDLRNLT